MLVTEKEASVIRCTSALVVLIMEAERLSGLQARTEGVSVNCIGARCMNWRWYKPVHGGEYGATPEISGKPGKTAPRGYCGLAGFIS